MYEQTMNNDLTMSGGENPLLAGRYQVVRQLGTGGMGSVWLAEDTQLDNKLFAVKMLPAVLVSNKRAYRQLKDEALMAMRLVHPNIVQIRAFEENNGNPFLVMDYIEGQTLDDYLAEKGKLSEDETVRLLKPIAAALDYAHGEGVVHRDVKPANIMIRKDGHPYILDFGIAREIQETMTRVTGKLSSGTLLYMSPEQLRGQPPKAAQDVYSFTAMAYECLKGEPPFSRGQIEYQILNEKPAPLSDGVKLSASIMRGLSKEAESRPDSCAGVLFAVSVIRPLSHVKVQAYTPPRRVMPPTVAKPEASRKSSMAGVVVPVVCVLVTLVVLGGVMWHRNAQRQKEERERAVAAQQEEAARLRQEEEERQAQEVARKKAQEEQLAKQKKAEEERRAKAEALRLEEEKRAKDAVVGIRIEAKVQKGKIDRISAEDGFKQKINVIDDLYIKVEALYENQRWQEAAAAYSNYVDRCKVLISLDGERQRAVAKRSEVQGSFKKAEEAGAKTYAKDSWNAAVKTWNVAAAEFKRMDFAEAAETFAKAAREFDACKEEVKKNKRIAEEKLAEERRLAEAREAERRHREEVARQAEEIRWQEARRKAMQSLPGKWKCQTTLKHSYGGGAATIQYEYSFRNDGTFTETRTSWSHGYESQKSVNTTTGTWVLSGSMLSLRFASFSIRLPNGSVSNYDLKGKMEEYNVLWKDDGSFESRYANLEQTYEGKVTKKITYDSNGNAKMHVKTKGGFLTLSQEYDIYETAKIFRRVAN